MFIVLKWLLRWCVRFWSNSNTMSLRYWELGLVWLPAPSLRCLCRDERGPGPHEELTWTRSSGPETIVSTFGPIIFNITGERYWQHTRFMLSQITQFQYLTFSVYFSLRTLAWRGPRVCRPRRTVTRWWPSGTGRLTCCWAPPSTPPPLICGAWDAFSTRWPVAGPCSRAPQSRTSCTWSSRWDRLAFISFVTTWTQHLGLWGPGGGLWDHRKEWISNQPPNIHFNNQSWLNRGHRKRVLKSAGKASRRQSI